MLNITWRDGEEALWIWKNTKVQDIMETISKLKWNWAWSYVTRITDNCWTTRITFWIPQGHTRNQERPRTRWRSDLKNFVKHWHCKTWSQWRSMGKAHDQRQTFKGWNWTNLFNLSTCITFLHHYVPYKIRDSLGSVFTWLHFKS